MAQRWGRNYAIPTRRSIPTSVVHRPKTAFELLAIVALKGIFNFTPSMAILGIHWVQEHGVIGVIQPKISHRRCQNADGKMGSNILTLDQGPSRGVRRSQLFTSGRLLDCGGVSFDRGIVSAHWLD
ncbi:hypothetical protein B0J15DRAFT_502981 [Fusarium solani]|uniref:Uncharacterized protein n=1 Tax=Fusarium solani TaxID=169388 RepID=A0A9P9GFF5_FUSSL|nr:uncharacterized protein B0J15DRAFT_502981 [Fusarium solani]KAH7237833.1 hypothetical protein B0J15DRAFT_502981 [Fusarium solani]